MLSRKEAARKDRQKLQGTWYRVLIAHRGAAFGSDKGDTITYEGDRYVQWENGQVAQVGTFAIVDATARPKRIEYTCTAGSCKGLRFRSIYTLDGDELGEGAYAVGIRAGERIQIHDGSVVRVLDVIPVENEDSPARHGPRA